MIDEQNLVVELVELKGRFARLDKAIRLGLATFLVIQLLVCVFGITRANLFESVFDDILGGKLPPLTSFVMWSAPYFLWGVVIVGIFALYGLLYRRHAAWSLALAVFVIVGFKVVGLLFASAYFMPLFSIMYGLS